MLDLKILRHDPEKLKKDLAVKNFDFDVERFLALEARRKELQAQVEQLQNERNSKSKAIGKAKASGEDITPLVAEIGDLGERLEKIKTEFEVHSQNFEAFLLEIPNIPDASVPAGLTEEDNEEISRWGEIPEHNFEPLDHVSLGEQGGIDFNRAIKVTGSRFVVLNGAVARLHRAIGQFMLDVHVSEHGYQEVYVPYIVNAQSLKGTGQLPKFAADQFKLEHDSDYYLIPTAEVPVTNLLRDEIVNLEDLPIKFVCQTPCFRSEAGSHGKDTRGMIRQHQFEKVEMVQFVHPDKSWQAHEELTSHAENILKKLELPFRSVILCGGDLGFTAAKTIDLEVWLPGQNKYREISSCSNYLDFQARRMLVRFRDPEVKKPRLVHTLNGSGLAIGRTLVAVMENYQDGDGRVHVPDVLRPYMGGVTEIELSDV